MESAEKSYAAPEPALEKSAGFAELVALLALVVLADLTIYRGHGYAGIAAFCVSAPVLVTLGAVYRRPLKDLAIVSVLLAGVGVRLIWCGGVMSAAFGFLLVPAYAMALTGRRPFVMGLFAFLADLIPTAHKGLGQYRDDALGVRVPSKGLAGMSGAAVILPAMALIVFGLLFTLANPDVLKWFGDEFAAAFTHMANWLKVFSYTEPLFWIVAAYIGVGLLRARINPVDEPDSEETHPVVDRGSLPNSLYLGYRNTLLVVTLMFGFYLVFEFQTLWSRQLPSGFNYAGYAHQGAFWLTVALALATVILCAVFRGSTLGDSRLPTLRVMAAVWSIENILLAAAVYNRLTLYVNYNGLTRLRTVGYLGTSAVVAGLLLVLWKIVANRNSTWLVRRQLWVLALAIYFYAVAPVDRWITQYNVGRVLAGKYAPPIYSDKEFNSVEGLMMLAPLLDASDSQYREGTKLRLAQELGRRDNQPSPHWTALQIAEEQFRRQLDGLRSRLK